MKQTKGRSSKILKDNVQDFPANNLTLIVGVGASAGGLEAFKGLLSALPETCAMAYVLVHHLDPSHKSDLSALLATITKLTVLEATQGLKILPKHVYVIPPNTSLTLKHGILQLEPRADASLPYLPIDHFLCSLADDQQANAIAVILSGTGSDGTQGVAAIKAVGGITFAQEETSAKYPGMPQSAIRSGNVDFILPLDQIAAELSRIEHHPFISDLAELRDTPATYNEEIPALLSEDKHFKTILKLLRTTSGVDFSTYRDTTIKRRIVRRMILHAKAGLGDYVELLEKDSTEAEALYNDLLINVTSFFRDPETFAIIKDKIFPQILKSKKPGETIRLWVPGCSTGQEAYSLAMLLLECLDDQPCPPVQIFATDLSDTQALRRAREGFYPKGIETEVSSERLNRFFTKENGGYSIDTRIKEMCVFAKHNVATDPPFSRVDLISCRNLLIYLSLPLQRRVIPTFHYALNTEGFLLLGASETVGVFTDLFNAVEPKHRIYIKKASAGRQYQHFNAKDFRVQMALDSGSTLPVASPADWQRAAERMIVEKYAPVGWLVNENLDILQFHGHTSPYLEHAAGEPSHNLLRMTSDELFPTLRSAIDECRRQNKAVHRNGIRLRKNANTSEINIEVLPVQPSGSCESCFLILFTETSVQTKGDKLPVSEDTHANESEVIYLRQELVSMHEYMQSFIEQKDWINAEMKSTSEEMLSSNEELQSTNEELETAKEELQSVNEELTTVNEQLQFRNQELNQLNDDLTNLQSSAGVPIILLSANLRVRHFTKAAIKALALLPSPQDNSFSSLKASLSLPDLEQIIEEVTTSLQVSMRAIQNPKGRWYMLEIHPYRTGDNKIDGSVIVMLDINEIKRKQEELLEASKYTETIINTVLNPLMVLDEKLCVQMANPAFYQTFLVTPEETEHHFLYELGNRQWDIAELRHKLKTICDHQTKIADYEVRHTFESVGNKTMLLNASSFIRHVGTKETCLILLTMQDISERKHLEEELKKSAEKLTAVDLNKDEFLATLAHELRNPLAPLRNALEILRLPNTKLEMIKHSHQIMDNQLTQMVRLVDDLLDISRISRGKIELRLERVELGKIVESAIETSRPFIEKAGHTLTVIQPDESLWLEIDSTRIEQVLVNLLNNAAKYTKENGRIRLDVQREGSNVILRVTDNGIGMTAVNLPNIFDMFSQIDSSIERTQGGLGIGLALVKKLVELHGGNVSVTSGGSGQGSEFMVILPLAISRDTEQNIELQKKKTPTKAENSKCVLIVDDNELSAKTMGWMLELLGYEAHLAFDGPSALTQAGMLRPDIVLLDIGLPGMNGYDVCNAMRQKIELKDTLMIAQTGWGQQEHRLRSKNAGFDYHLVKPVALEALQEVLNLSKTSAP
ncbi:MAG: chemotaxis protein CheB [Pseudomonadota bacterium]